ncbi:ubiquitin-like superfamily protein [Artemisia annua]|uniref:Ubiquitin-like superfamily protein n=1 Tax=Artemisia annua TaxID=35608 RepID=A0A2U1PF89_ARTAN|nr:ubiquitin-like superfamily protein [Artemisia annua]
MLLTVLLLPDSGSPSAVPNAPNVASVVADLTNLSLSGDVGTSIDVGDVGTSEGLVHDKVGFGRRLSKWDRRPPRWYSPGDWLLICLAFDVEVGEASSTCVSLAMYIRVKRNKTTYFLQCDATEKILDIKQKLHDLIDQPVFDQRLILVATGEVLDDSKTLADQKVENDAVVALVLRKDDNEFEDVNIVKPDDFYPSRDADPSGNW